MGGLDNSQLQLEGKRSIVYFKNMAKNIKNLVLYAFFRCVNMMQFLLPEGLKKMTV